jgi:uncharacterized protein YoxC
LQRQIVEISTRLQRMSEDIGEIKNILAQIDQRVRALEQSDAGRHPVIIARVDAAWRKIDEHDARIQSVETAINTISLAIESLKQPVRIATWVAVVVGGAIITWIVSRWLMP